MDVSYRCYRLLSPLLLLIAWASVAGSDERVSTEGGEWLEKSRALIESAAKEPRPEWLNATSSDAAMAMAEGIARESGLRGGRTTRSAAYGRGSVLIFGSLSMPEETLKNLLDQAAERQVTFVLRGLVDATNIRATIQGIHRVIGDSASIPNVIIDPTLYQRFNVTVAPTLVLLREGQLPPVTVVGAVSVDWLRRQARRIGTSGDPDLGVRAEYHDIAEVDLIVEMQRRLASIDWVSKRQAAIDQFWRKKAGFVHLPDADEDREFSVDPSVRITEDIRDADGKVLLHAGDILNPLDLLPLSKTVVVFNGTDRHQLEIAAGIADRVRDGGRGVILLTTTVDVERGWDSVHGMEQDLSGPVYLLQANLAERFQLRRVPSTVTSRGNRLVVTEFAVQRGDE